MMDFGVLGVYSYLNTTWEADCGVRFDLTPLDFILGAILRLKSPPKTPKIQQKWHIPGRVKSGGSKLMILLPY